MLVVVAGSLVLLLGIAALVLDLAGLRADRALSRTVTDQAATAGVLELGDGDGQIACQTALAYLDLNMPDGPFTGANCSAMPAACSSGTAAVSTTANAGRWTATLTYPVPDGHPLLNPATIGNTTQVVVPDDGDRCERFGVQIDGTRQYFFAELVGASSGDTEVHAVAKGQVGDGTDLALNLLVLERHDCDAISASGSGSGVGGIITDAVYNPNTGELEPGWIASDSDGSGAGCAGNGVINVDGSNAFIRADGPAGCSGELGTHGGVAGLDVGEGCGEIRVAAPGTPGCNQPACTSSGTVAPEPRHLSRRITRSPVDHRYNCKGTYNFGVGWEIDPCPEPPAPHIDELIADYGVAGTTPPGFVKWTSLGHSCTVSGPPGTTITASGDIHVDCSKFTVNRSVHFTGGDVVFDGDVKIQSDAEMAINADVSGPAPYVPASNAAVVYMRDGEISKAGSGSLLIHRSLVYLSVPSQLSLTGGTGSLVWTAPTTGDFEDLALWSDSPALHKWAGQALLELEGVFFTPVAEATYRGQGTQEQVAAQFIARKLSATGKGLLVVRPKFNRAVLFPTGIDSSLIR